MVLHKGGYLVATEVGLCKGPFLLVVSKVIPLYGALGARRMHRARIRKGGGSVRASFRMHIICIPKLIINNRDRFRGVYAKRAYLILVGWGSMKSPLVNDSPDSAWSK